MGVESKKLGAIPPPLDPIIQLLYTILFCLHFKNRYSFTGVALVAWGGFRF
jgi:hypothetical protein